MKKKLILLLLFVSSTQAQPLLDISQIQYEGAFRLPTTTFGNSSMNSAQGALAYNPANHSIFIVGHVQQQAIAEFKIPELVLSNQLTDLNMAEDPLQGFVSVLNRRIGSTQQTLDRIGGMALFEGPQGPELLINAYMYYDASVSVDQSMLVVRNANDLNNSVVDGAFVVSGGPGHTAGWISPVPRSWQEALDGTHITGQSSGMPIIGRTSVGPAAFSFDPYDVVGKSTRSGVKKVPVAVDHHSS